MSVRTASVRAEPQTNVALSLYRMMQVIRQTEEELARCHQRGLVHGACHTYVGQEAIATGVCAHLTTQDVVFSTHRGHGHALAKGMPPRELMAELFGRETGCSRGRGGSMHLFSPEIGMMGTSGIVAPCILQACGGGYSSKLMDTGLVAVAFFGDGAVNNGAFHEGLNMASIWKLPVLFVCENNQFATEVPFAYASGNPDVGGRGAMYGMPGVVLDGNDVGSIYEAAGDAVRRARAGGGPTLLECRTYRTRAHAEGMSDFTYRTREAVEEWKTRCPIQSWRKRLLTGSNGSATGHAKSTGETGSAANGAGLAAILPPHGTIRPEQLDAIDQEVQQLVQAARQFAEQSAPPAAASAQTHVYAAVEPQAGTAVEPAAVAAPDAGETAPAQRKITYSQATLEALTAEMAANPRIFVMGEGIGKRGGNFMTTKGLYDRFGAERLCDTPICERGFVGLACGAAMTGTRPIIDFMFADFVLDGFGEIVNQIAKMQYMSSGRLRMPLLLRGCIGIGHSAATHHSGSYYGIYGQVPGLRVVVPSSPYDAKGLLTHALRCQDPVLFLEHREILQLKGDVPEAPYEIPFGQARTVRSGSQMTVVALARMVVLADDVCQRLEQERGLSIELIDPRTVSPLDRDAILQSVRKTGRLLILDECPAQYGFSSEIAAVVADAGFNDLDAPVQRLTGAFCPTPYSPSLESAVIPGPAEIEAAILSLLEE